MTYKNGNTLVSIDKRTGTKIRYIPDNQKPMPEFPESIDLAITNMCEMGCEMCYSQSTKDGLHADLNHPLLDTLHEGTELAIGGGNPMAHPHLVEFLQRMKDKGVLCNMTVHWNVFNTRYEELNDLLKKKLLHGLGVSINEIVPCEVLNRLEGMKTTVIHSILGVCDEVIFRHSMNRDLNILLLGYKTIGRGDAYFRAHESEIARNAVWVKQNLPLFVESYKAVSFDNLAISQLALQKQLNEEHYNQIFMGEDGSFTMYIDLVEEKFAPSSIHYPRKINANSIDELFKQVRR